jgi:hypothetical protein
MATDVPDRRTDDLAMGYVVAPETLYRALTTELSQPVDEPQQQGSNISGQNPQTQHVLLFMSLSLTILALASLFTQWHSNDSDSWTFFWVAGSSSLLVSAMTFWVALNLRRMRRRQSIQIDVSDMGATLSVQGLRRAVLAGNDEFAPQLSSSESLGMEAHEPDTVKVPPPERRFYWWSVIPLMFNAGFMAFLFEMEVQSYHDSSAPWQWFALLLLVVIEYLWVSYLLTRHSSNIHVQAREDGLHWRGADRRWSTLPWSEIRGWSGFSMDLLNTRSGLQPSAIYTVIGQHATLTWLSLSSKESSIAASRRLIMLIQSRTSLPLRDLTPSVSRLVVESRRESRRTRKWLLATRVPKFWGLSGLPYSTARVVLALSLLTVVAGVLMPVAQQAVYGQQLQQFESTYPQTRDPLTSNVLQWIPGAASSSLDYPIPNTVPPPPNILFTPFGYVFLSGSCCDLSSRISRTMDDGLIEVNVRQLADFDLSSVGLLFRVSEREHTALAFVITANGNWQLLRFRLDESGTLTNERDLRREGIFGGIRAIHQGQDTTNQLAVLMQGSSYTFFVNGQFVGGYEANGLPLSGQIGVYTDGLASAVTFSDLLIVPT